MGSGRRTRWVVAASATVVAVALIAPAASDARGPAGIPAGGQELPAAAAAAGGVPTTPILAFDDAQATAANGAPLSAGDERTCGADDRRFLGELLQGSPFDYKIPYRLGDVADGNVVPTARDGRQWYISGVAESSSVGAGDFPFDHPFGSDFNMDLDPDAPYTFLSQVGGVESDRGMHVELSAGQFPHLDAPVGPAAGMEWDTNSAISRANLHTGYIPEVGERVLVAGRWIADCGHPPFQTEIHPLSFMARAHVDGDTTVAQAFYAPYRETQLYNPDQSVANKVYDDSRFAVTPEFDTEPFPTALIAVILGLQDQGPWAPIERLYSWGLIEANRTSPVDWLVCAPEGTSGDRLDIRYDFAARPGVAITVVEEPGTGCARVTSSLGTQVSPDPVLRECVLPWDFLNEVAGAEAGVPGLDLQVQLGAFIPPAYQHRLDAAPILDCYDPLRGPPVSNDPPGQDVTVVDDLDLPFYGRVEVAWATDPPPSSTTSSSTSSSTTMTGRDRTELTVSPATVEQGGVIDVVSRGWDPGSTVTFDLDGVVLGSAVADADGALAVSFTVPSDTPTGVHQVRAVGRLGGAPVEVATPITVLAASTTTATGSLPRTGSDLAAFMFGGVALVAAGAALVLAVRARRMA